jgi:4-hydroxy-3-methylbut-2-enyl diphosphate reductase
VVVVQIIRASEMGFCFGVRRAVEMMEDAVRDRGDLVSLGSVVHNPQVVDKLRTAGLDVIDDVSQAKDRPVAISAHGVGPDVIEVLQASGAEILDTTCPIVTRSQQWAKRLSEEGFAVVIFGDPQHKEVRGVRGWATGHVLVVASEEEVTLLPDGFPSRVGVLSQTTETEARFASFVKRLFETNLDRISELRVLNTLCHATTAQQAATIHLAAEVSLMLVVGGRDSANTRHLAVVARECGVETHHIETSTEIEAGWLVGHEKVGVTAGASTPDFVIDEVVSRLEQLAP